MSDNVSVEQAEAESSTDEDLRRELEYACVRGDLSKMNDLIIKGADPHAECYGVVEDETLLHVACKYAVHVILNITCIPVVSTLYQH